MEKVLLVSLVVCLVVSWIYILLLKARISDCMNYIVHRINKRNPGLKSMDGSSQEERETAGSENPSHIHSSDVTPSPSERATMFEKPKLIISTSGKGQPIYYMCSRCLREFSLPEDPSPKEAVRELYRRFKEHVEQEHPEPSARPPTASLG